jgi:flagella basal body P-ring formation protein FlgA
MSKIKNSSLAVALFTLLYAAVAYGGARIEFLDKVIVEGDTIRLGDLAMITADSTRLKWLLEEIEVGKAPLPGKERRLESSYLRMRISSVARGVPDLTFSGSGEIVVLRSHLTVERGMVIAVVRKHILDNAPWKVEDMELTITPPHSRITVPRGELKLEVVWPRGADYAGAMNVPVKLTVNQGDYETTLNTSVRIRLFQNVVTTAHKLQAAHILGPDDVKIERVEVTDIYPQVHTSTKDVLNHRTTSFIAQDKVLLKRMIKPVPAVAVGGKVTIQARVGNVRVTTPGEARSSGLIGDLIQVQNMSSGKIIQGKVVAESVVMADNP